MPGLVFIQCILKVRLLAFLRWLREIERKELFLSHTHASIAQLPMSNIKLNPSRVTVDMNRSD